jgi:choline dehydrogenase-like flavoprotein
VGTARMGDDPTLSVTNQYGQCWDADNLFLMDGSVFASEAHKNPTLTILMLAMRNSEYLAQQLSKGEL